MPAVRRPSSSDLLLDLTRRLAEEFDVVPLSLVRDAVHAAAAATQLFGDDVAASLDIIERIAREDLTAVRDAAADDAAPALAG